MPSQGLPGRQSPRLRCRQARWASLWRQTALAQKLPAQQVVGTAPGPLRGFNFFWWSCNKGTEPTRPHSALQSLLKSASTSHEIDFALKPHPSGGMIAKMLSTAKRATYRGSGLRALIQRALGCERLWLVVGLF